MALPSDWRGYIQTHDVPGAFCVARRILVAGSAGFGVETLRSSAWFADCPWLAADGQTAADAVTRGILKRLVIRFVPSSEDARTTGSALHVADKDPTAAGDGFNAVTASSGVFERTYPTFAERATFYRRAFGGDVVADVELYFDIPPAPEV